MGGRRDVESTVGKAEHIDDVCNPSKTIAKCSRLGGGAYSIDPCLSRMTIDYASLARRSTVPTWGVGGL